MPHAIHEIFCWWISPSSKSTVTDGPSRQASLSLLQSLHIHNIYTNESSRSQLYMRHQTTPTNLPTQCPSLKRTCDIFLHALAEVGCVYRAVWTEFLSDIQRTVHRDIVLDWKPTRCTISEIYLIKYSTCFGHVHRPSSGVSQHCIHAIGICHASSVGDCQRDQNGTF
jgi:hypothetical protein